MTSRIKSMCAAAVVLVSVAIAYSNGLQGVFVYDDLINIVNNQAMRDWRTAVAGTSRPLTNLTFWLQFRLGLTHTSFFHALNLLLHLVNSLLLWQILLHVARRRAAGRRLLLATATAVLWGVHPVQSEAVTYIVQRAELLSVTFLFAGFLLGLECSRARRRTGLISVYACFVLAYLSKPTAVVAPFLFFVLDAALSGSVRKAWREHRTIHLLGLLTLAVPALLLCMPHESSTSAGFGMTIVSFSEYLMFQPRAMVLYLWKLVWPRTLLIEYGYGLDGVREALMFLAVLGLCIAGLIRMSRRGGLARIGGTWFAVSLLPVAFVPLADLFAEHRLYLPSAGAALVFGSALLSMCRERVRIELWQSRAFIVIVAAFSLALAVRSIKRNLDYRDDLILWQQVVESRPENVRGHLGVGAALAVRGDLPGGEHCFRMAISSYRGLTTPFLKASFRTDYAYACRNLGALLSLRGEDAAAEEMFIEAKRNASVFK